MKQSLQDENRLVALGDLLVLGSIWISKLMSWKVSFLQVLNCKDTAGTDFNVIDVCSDEGRKSHRIPRKHPNLKHVF